LRTGSQGRFPRKGPKQGSQGQVASKLRKNRFPSKGSKNRFPRTGSQEQVQVPRTNSLGRVRTIGCQHGSHEHVPKHGFKARFLSKAFNHSFASKVSNNRLTGKAVKKGSKARLQERFNEQIPKQGSQEQVAHVPRNSFPRTTCKAKFRRTAARKVPKDRFLNKAPKQSYEKQVPEQGPNEQV